jgi:hypothetical protein
MGASKKRTEVGCPQQGYALWCDFLILGEGEVD